MFLSSPLCRNCATSAALNLRAYVVRRAFLSREQRCHAAANCGAVDWFTAVVLWVGYGEVLAHHATPTTTEGFRQVFPFDSIIAVGTLSDLIDYREHCWRAVEDQERAVRACEADLGKARYAVWKVLDQLRVKAPESSEDAKL